MNRRLAPVLSRADLPLAELCAARLDGELFRVDECFSPVDSPTGRIERAAALAAIVPARLIAELSSAAWVWGALHDPPVPHRLCVDTLARAHPALASGGIVREVVVEPGDVVRLGGMRVTSVLRTCADIARFSDFTASDRQTVRALLVIGGARAEDCVHFLGRRRNLPHKRRAIDRLSVLPP